MRWQSVNSGALTRHSAEQTQVQSRSYACCTAEYSPERNWGLTQTGGGADPASPSWTTRAGGVAGGSCALWDRLQGFRRARTSGCRSGQLGSLPEGGRAQRAGMPPMAWFRAQRKRRLRTLCLQCLPSGHAIRVAAGHTCAPHQPSVKQGAHFNPQACGP